jgi:hypothetical protein
MSKRVTVRDLDAIANRLNVMTGSPTEAYTNGRANVGNFHISQAYGGYSLHRIDNASGGIREVLRLGHVPARELQTAMFAYIYGMMDYTGTLTPAQRNIKSHQTA